MSKSDNSNNNKSGGIGFCGLLTIVFVTLKLCKVIAWSWWWILAPMWIPLTLVLSIIGLGLIGVLIGSIVDKIQIKRRRKKREHKDVN